MVKGAEAALQASEIIAGDPSLANYYLTRATRGDLLAQLGRYAEAAENFRVATALACSEPERRFLNQRLAETLDQARRGQA